VDFSAPSPSLVIGSSETKGAVDVIEGFGPSLFLSRAVRSMRLSIDATNKTILLA
jgi:hypothetical protein